MKKAVVCGSFDNLKSRDIRFLQEASKLGILTVFLWTDNLFEELEGNET
jgi:hypothetical protein